MTSLEGARRNSPRNEPTPISGIGEVNRGAQRIFDRIDSLVSNPPKNREDDTAADVAKKAHEAIERLRKGLIERGFPPTAEQTKDEDKRPPLPSTE